MTTATEFQPFPKIARLNRDIIITEKIDGTNAAVGISEDGQVYAQSRKRVITPDQDNFGFARWVTEHAEALRDVLGPGLHFGEWYGRGIQRGYGIRDSAVGADGKLFALFNATRWADVDASGIAGLTVVPVLGRYTFDTAQIRDVAADLDATGSHATGAVGYDRPEGVVVYHGQGNILFKVTLENDERGKEHGA